MRKGLWDKYYTQMPQNDGGDPSEIRNSQESLMKLAKRFGVNPKTIAKWKKRESPADLPMGPKIIKSTVLSEAEERAIVAFRRMTELPLDDVLYSLQDTIPHLQGTVPHAKASLL